VQGLGALLVLIGLLLIVLTWTESTGQVIAAVIGVPK
jgi:hypothetical protein